MPGPLAHLTVLDLSRVMAGPWAGQIFADLGATVIKIERPGSGDDARAWRPPEIGGMSTGFAALNRSKKSVALDLDRPEGQRIVAQLAAGADVLVHSLKPGSAEALRAATLYSARWAGMADSIGAIRKGHAADLVLLDADPLAAVENLRKVRGVVSAGRWLDRGELDRIVGWRARE